MRLLAILWILLVGAPLATAADGKSHELSPKATILWQNDWFAISNSMVVTWTVAALLILVTQVAMSRGHDVPTGLQNFWEWLIEELHLFLEGLLGAHLIKGTFWFFASLFLFILFTNWFGLVPGVGTVGWGVVENGHFHLTEPLMRGGNADLNMTSAMALLFFALWLFWSLRALGVGGFLAHIFGGQGGTGAMRVFFVAIFFFVGLIEVISIAFRPVSLSFRLYGNVFAGENILESMLQHPWLGWLLPLPFYFLELLVGLVQALVFTLLTAVFTSLMVGQGHPAEGEGAGAHAKH